MLNYITSRAFLMLSCLSVFLAACNGAATPRPTFDAPQATFPPIPTVEPLAKVTTNNAWPIRSAQIDGFEMVLVPPGCFTLGSETGTDYEKPVTPLCIDKPFWIDRYEVTDEQFTRLNGVANYPAHYWPGLNYPRVEITWFEATDFCKLRGGRLPTEAEWEFAAKGPDNLTYSWGNIWNPAETSGVGTSGPKPVGSVEGVMTWVGAKDMTGNVWEWTSSILKPYPYDASDGRENQNEASADRVIRGGAYGPRLQTSSRTSNRKPETGNRYYYDVGFRCVRDVQ